MDLTTIIAIVTIVIGIVGALAKIVWDQSQKRLDVLEEGLHKLVTREEMDALRKNLDSLEKKVDQIDREHDEKTAEMTQIVEGMRESLADARETIAGFGSSYLTRREFREDHKE